MTEATKNLRLCLWSETRDAAIACIDALAARVAALEAGRRPSDAPTSHLRVPDTAPGIERAAVREMEREAKVERDAAVKRAETAEAALDVERRTLTNERGLVTVAPTVGDKQAYIAGLHARVNGEIQRLTAELDALRGAKRTRPVTVREVTEEDVDDLLDKWRERELGSEQEDLRLACAHLGFVRRVPKATPK